MEPRLSCNVCILLLHDASSLLTLAITRLMTAVTCFTIAVAGYTRKRREVAGPLQTRQVLPFTLPSHCRHEPRCTGCLPTLSAQSTLVTVLCVCAGIMSTS